MSNLKIGGNSTGLFVGNKQILGGENILEYKDNAIAAAVVINLMDKPANLSYQSDGSIDENIVLLPKAAFCVTVNNRSDYNIFCTASEGKTYRFMSIENGSHEETDTGSHYLFDLYSDVNDISVAYILEEI